MKKSGFYFCMLFCLLSVQSLPQHFVPVNGVGTDRDIKCMLTDTIHNLLYIGGGFSKAGNLNIGAIASYDGTNFDSLPGSGIATGCCPNPTWAMGMYYNNLILGETWYFDWVQHKSHYIVQWNGIQWDTIAGWLDMPNSGNTNLPLCFLEHNGELYVGGSFIKIGGNPQCVDLAKWNGSQWTGITTGLDSSTWPGNLVALCFYDNKLYYGGYFGGDSIVDFGYLDSLNNPHPVPGFVDHLYGGPGTFAIYHNEFYVGGGFTKAGGNAGNYIMKWNGATWQDVGGGMSGAGSCAVEQLIVYNDNLYACGVFSYAGGVHADNIARWDGNSWYALSTDSFAADIYCMAFFKNELYISTANDYNYFAKYTGTLPNGINENTATINSFSVSPNPATKKVVVSFSRPLPSAGMVVITNVLGQNALPPIHLSKGEGRKEIDISELARGVYFVRVRSEEKQWVEKIVVE
jgi:hypothetical protein